MVALDKLCFLGYHFLLTQILYFCKGFCPTYLRAPFMDDRLYMSYTAMLNTSHMGECIQACSNDDVCTSFFYNHGTKQCALVEGGLSSNTATQNSTGWMYYDCYHSEYNTSTMFFFGTETVNWETAKSNCQERNAYLAEPDNEDLYNFFKEKVSKYGTTYWTGGYFTPDDNNWRWIRFNTSFKYRNWNQDYTLETPYCLVMPYQDAWLPAACHETHRYACQRDNV